jgi:hypothetical protein
MACPGSALWLIAVDQPSGALKPGVLLAPAPTIATRRSPTVGLLPKEAETLSEPADEAQLDWTIGGAVVGVAVGVLVFVAVAVGVKVFVGVGVFVLVAVAVGVLVGGGT